MLYRPTPTLEEEADALLEGMAKEANMSLRKMGVINHRRERTINQREVPFSYAFSRRRQGRDG